MKKICSYFLIGTMFVILLVGCSNGNTKEDREITFKNEEGEILASTSDFAKASVEQRDQDEHKVIQLTFKEEGKSEEITEPHIGETIYVYFGEELISSPRISAAISGKEIIIVGAYKEETANQFVDKINSQ